MSHQEKLKSMLQDIIHNRQEQAEMTMHDYFVAKSRDVAGLGGQTQQADPSSDDLDDQE